MKKYFKTPVHAQKTDIALLLLRLLMGVAFILHGWGKIQAPMSWMGPESTIPGIIQLLGAVSEFGGGIALILGLLVPLASLGLIFTMIGAVYMHAVINGDPFVGPQSYELAALYLVLSILFLLVGPGRFSVDRKVFGAK